MQVTKVTDASIPMIPNAHNATSIEDLQREVQFR